MSFDVKGFRYNKALGQNFIFDEDLLDSIASVAVEKGTSVLEIGAGAGTLTESILKRAGKVVSFEIDRNLKTYLENKFNGTVDFVFGDIMNYSVEDINSLFDGKYCVVANLPYYITTPVIMKFLEGNANITSMTLMMQKEVAERLTAKCDSKAYGAVSVAVDFRCNAEIVSKVGRENFYPVPNVDSAVVKFNIAEGKYAVKSQEVFRDTVRCGFLMRRKTLVNNLMSYFRFSRPESEQLLMKAAIEPNVRGETLSTEKYIGLSDLIFEKISDI